MPLDGSNLTITPTARILLGAADLVRHLGLAKFTQEDDIGRVCLHGAISIARFGRPYQEGYRLSCIPALNRYFGTNNTDHGFAGWNNEPKRTAEEVIEALEGAAYLDMTAAHAE